MLLESRPSAQPASSLGASRSRMQAIPRISEPAPKGGKPNRRGASALWPKEPAHLRAQCTTPPVHQRKHHLARRTEPPRSSRHRQARRPCQRRRYPSTNGQRSRSSPDQAVQRTCPHWRALQPVAVPLTDPELHAMPRRGRSTRTRPPNTTCSFQTGPVGTKRSQPAASTPPGSTAKTRLLSRYRTSSKKPAKSRAVL